MDDEFDSKNNETPLTQITDTDYNGNDYSTNNYTESQYSENDFLKAYIGEKADKIMNSKINICAAFFGPLWFIYRRCIAIGIGLSILVSYVSTFLAKLIGYELLSYLFTFLFYLFTANSIYLSNAKSNVRNIIKKNSDLPNDALMEIVIKKGGVKVQNVVIAIVLVVAFVLSLLAFYYFFIIMFLRALGAPI